MTPSLEKKIALITGGASGLGRAIANHFRINGATVIITDVQADLGREVAMAEGVLFLEQEVCDETRWQEVVEEIERLYGQLDILVNNAGIVGSMEAVSPEDTRLDEWRRLFSVNVDSVFLGCRAAIPAMRRAGGGSIINMSSVAGLSATPYATAYGATKATIRQLTKSVAQYCAEQQLNIRCNSVHPGNVRTPLWDEQAQERAATRGMTFEAYLAEAKARNPMGDFSMPADVAASVAFLGSDAARRITGSEMIIDGGMINCNTFHVSAAYEAVFRGSHSNDTTS